MTTIEDQFPISLKHLQEIIDRVHNRYPLVEKYDIAVTIKAFIDTIRSILLDGNIITIHHLFSNMYLNSYRVINKSKYNRIVRVKMTTAKRLKQ